MADDSLYVGYLPLPPKHARFLRVFIPVSLWALVILNGAILFAMRDPGAAAWDTNDTVTVSGMLRDDGSPVLTTDEGESILLVRDSKIAAFEGPTREGPITITGFVLERDGRRMLEITQAESDRISARTDYDRYERALPRAAPATMRGEILDAKCYMGAMKPGDGKTHKSCATLCVRGGVPAAVRVIDPDGSERLALVVGPGFTPFPASALEFIGDEVEFSGQGFRIGDLDAIAIDPATIRRVSR